MMFPYENQLRRIISGDPERMAALRAVQALALPQGMIGAGYIRTAVWDHLCGLPPSAVDDIDVIYFDPADVSKDTERIFEDRLKAIHPGPDWSVRNQARMAARNHDRPYTSLADALSFWLETPTCVAMGLTDGGGLEIIAPFGLDDLFAMRVRPTPRGRERATDYRLRIETKRWHEKWPGVKIELP